MKTAVTITEASILDNIEGAELKTAFKKICDIARGKSDPGYLTASAGKVHELAVFSDKLIDLGLAIAEAIKTRKLCSPEPTAARLPTASNGSAAERRTK